MITVNSKPNRPSDWKEYLCVEDEQRLNQLLDSTKRNRCAYMSAEDAQIAQVWCAMIEQMRMINKLEQRVAYIERILDRLFKGHDEEKKALLEGIVRC